MINRLSNPINRNRSAAKILHVMSSTIDGPLYKLIMMGNQRKVTLTILAIVKTGLSLYKQTWALYMASM